LIPKRKQYDTGYALIYANEINARKPRLFALRAAGPLMAQFGHGPGRPVLVGREGCDQRLSDDEALLMAALAAAQAGDLAIAEVCLRQVCSRDRVPAGLEALTQLVTALQPHKPLLSKPNSAV
jgi:hypothetical protein